MSTLSSTSTMDELLAAYDDNASWFEDASVTKAACFITACTMLLNRVAKRVRRGSPSSMTEVEIDPAVIRQQMQDAKAFVAQNGAAATGGGGAVGYSFEDFRG